MAKPPSDDTRRSKDLLGVAETRSHKSPEDFMRLHHELLEALQESEERFRSIVQNSPMGAHIYQLEADGRLVLIGANPAADRFTGVDSRTLIGRTLEEGFPALVGTEVPERYRRAAQDGTPWQMLGLEYDDGQIHGVFDVFAFRTSPNRMAVQFLDVTNRFKAEESLRQNEATLRSIFRAAPVGIGVVANRVFVRVNERITEMTGYTAEELVGQSARMLYPTQEEFEEVGRVKYAQIRERGTGTVETRWQRQDGRIINILLSSSPINPEDWSAGITFTALDITDRKRAEDERRQLEVQLRQFQKMEAIGQLAGGVAHDFNNLLQVIQGYTQMTLVDRAEDPEVVTNLTEVRKTADRGASLIRQLLVFSRRDVLQTQRLNVNDLVADFLKMLRRVIGEHVEVVVHAGQKTPPVIADPTQLQQILMNLCVNARDAMPKGGTITIETGATLLDRAWCDAHPGAREGPHVFLRIGDTGPGIPPEIRDRIFEPFFTTKEVGRGTGLGLATVYAIIQRHGGTIEVDNRPGHGARFTVYLPAIQHEEPTDEAARAAGPSVGGTETIFVAEDDELVRRLAVQVLTKAGYQVVLAGDGDEAVRLWHGQQVKAKLALLDVVMPKRNGPEVYEAIRATDPHVPVIFSSGYTSEALSADLLARKGVSLIQKPYKPDELLRAVRQVLDNRPVAGAN